MSPIIQNLEERFGKLPVSYKEWIEKGIPDNPSYLSYWFEWLPSADVLNCEIDPGGEGALEGIFPIAICHGVALWCIDNNNGQRVILCSHDDNVASLYAPSIEGWIYRICLNEATDFSDEEVKVRKTLSLYADLLANNKKEWSQHIKYLSEVSAQDCGVIVKQEVDDIVKKEFGIEYIDTYVEFLKPEDE